MYLGGTFKYFITYVYHNFSFFVHDNLNWWNRNRFWERSAAAIGHLMKKTRPFDSRNLVSHFIDWNCEETCVVGGGPRGSGANARRWPENVSRSFFNGWKSKNGLNHRTVDNACGFTEDIFCPTFIRRNDSLILGESRINARFMEEQAGLEDQFVIFGDSAYKKDSHMSSYHTQNNMIADFGN